jgi:hypothetical protein
MATATHCLRSIAPRRFEIAVSAILNGKPAEFSVNLGVPNRSGIFAHTIRDPDSIVFVQFFPLRLIGTDLDPAAVVEHPHFHDPLFVIGRPLVFDFLALFYRCHVILPDHDCVATFFSQAARPINDSATRQQDTIDFLISNLLCTLEHLLLVIPIAAC